MFSAIAAITATALAAETGVQPGALPQAYASGTYGSTDVTNLFKNDPAITDTFSKGWTPGLFYKWQTQFFANTCTSYTDIRDGVCTPTWFGAQPAQIRAQNTVWDTTNGKIQIRLRESPQHDFAAANAANDDDCGCVYETYTTGLLRSRSLVRGGYTEVRLKAPASEKTVSSIWFQSANVEVSAVNIQGGMLKTSGYVFDGDDTLSSHTVSSALSGAQTDFHVYGIEWRANNDIVIHVDGQELHTLAAADWYPSSLADSAKLYMGEYFPASQEANLMIDLQIAEDADLSAAVPASDLEVDYVQQWEFDCTTGLETVLSNSGAGGGNTQSIQGVAGGTCSQPGYAQMCHTYGRNLCDNPFPGMAEVTHEWDNVCKTIANAAMCGGYADWRTGPSGFPTGDSEDAKGWESGKGSYGHCKWDMTGGSQSVTPKITEGERAGGSCISVAPKRFDPYSGRFNQDTCGGPGTLVNPNTGFTNEDLTGGYGMYCFGQCVRKTTLNEGLFGWWMFMCNGAFTEAGTDFCETFTQASHTFNEVDTQGNQLAEPFLVTSWYECSMKQDIPGEDPSNRGLSCAMTDWLPKANAPYEVQDATYPGKRNGFYCVPRDHRQPQYEKGGIPPWRYTPYGIERCEEESAREWGCITGPANFNDGKKKYACRTSNWDQINVEGKSGQFFDPQYCSTTQAECENGTGSGTGTGTQGNKAHSGGFVWTQSAGAGFQCRPSGHVFSNPGN